MSFIWNAIKGLVAVAMVLAVLAVGAVIFVSVVPVLSTKSSAANNAQPVIFEVKPGQSVSEIADNLQKAGLIDWPLWFRIRCGQCSLKAGKFQITPGTDIDTIISILSTAPAEIGLKFQVIEGLRVEEIGEKLDADGVVSATNFLNLTTTPEGAARYEDAFITNSGKPADKGLEGFLFPDTYEIKPGPGDNSDAVINVMLQNMEAKFTPEMLQAISDRGLTVYQVLTMASIVQREGVVPDELPTIASVYWNRIDQDMLLNADPTLQYALGTPGNWWPDLDKVGVTPVEVPGPYNTYALHGLPPSPIANPGEAAIRAAIYPAQTDYLYFVAKCDGTSTHAFASTLEEHNRNVIQYQDNCSGQ